MLPALPIGDEEREGMKMGEDEQDMVSDKRASHRLRGEQCSFWS